MSSLTVEMGFMMSTIDRWARNVVVVVLVLLAGMIAWVQFRPNSDPTHFGFVWGNAAQVANPEYRVSFGGGAERGLFRTSMTAEIGSHLDEITPDRHPGFVEISQDLFGNTDRTEFPGSSLTRYLRKFRGGEGVDLSAKKSAEIQVRSLEPEALTTVIVELAAPLAEEDLDKLGFSWDLEFKRFFLSGSQSMNGKPLYWWPGLGGCEATIFVDHDCSIKSAVSQFRKWVSVLKDGDSASLANLGLDLRLLREAAARGKVYGFIANLHSRDRALDLLAKPEVRTLHIVERGREPE
ncbi:hypothetical protein ABZU75_44235 [Streptosporangium sp. NPDC005286]|uniref:hypothetical protein n=1 Tax=Streptosporangium sp. NPDC005286 TaxID=3154463 RepID=UPI0033BCB59B